MFKKVLGIDIIIQSISVMKESLSFVIYNKYDYINILRNNKCIKYKMEGNRGFLVDRWWETEKYPGKWNHYYVLVLRIVHYEIRKCKTINIK